MTGEEFHDEWCPLNGCRCGKCGPCAQMPECPTPVPSEATEAGEGEHHPDCYQRTGVPEDLPAGLCDCRVLRMLDAAAVTAHCTWGERGFPACQPGIRDRRYWCDPCVAKEATPAEPDAGEVQAKVKPEQDLQLADAGEVEALAARIAKIPLRQLGWTANAHDIAEGILASDWLAALLDRERRAGKAEEREQIAQDIEADANGPRRGSQNHRAYAGHFAALVRDRADRIEGDR